MPRDWFRRETWSEKEKTDFESRLGRARRSSRAQYLRIQGTHLADAGLLLEALQLLDRVVEQHPDDLQVTTAQHQRGQIFLRLGRTADALAAFRHAIARESQMPNVRTDAWLDFSLTVARQGLVDVYDEVLALLDRRTSTDPLATMFPVQVFKLHAARAMIRADRDEAGAAGDAAKALHAAASTDSGFQYHAHLGLVGDQYSEVQARLRTMVGG